MRWGQGRDPGRQALRELRLARRRHYSEQRDWVDALYPVYIGVIFGGWAVALIAGLLKGEHAGPHALHEIVRHGPAGLGLLAALAVAGGLRSGGFGGPLVIEAPDVQHVLLSPVDRGAVVRGVAVRRLRSAAFFAAAFGAVAGDFAFRSLPGSAVSWMACLGLFTAATALWGLGAALVASGRRLRQRWTSLAAAAIVGWSVADVLAATTTSPASLLGRLAIWPLRHAGASFAGPAGGLAIAAVTILAGLALIPGLSLEAARRRAALAAQIRFAVTLQDVRAVILVRRQLAFEIPRARPWIRLKAAPGAPNPVWRRDWQSLLRWPAVRVGRVVVLGAVIGLSLAGAWSGTTPLVIVAGLALLVAGLDAIEPLAQEVDHPTRRDLFPVRPDRLIRQHLAAPTALMAGVLVVAVLSALVVGAPARVLEVGGVMVVPTALLALCSAALSTTNDPFAFVLTPAMGYAQTAFPFVLTVLGGGGPLLAAREAARHGQSAVGAAVSSELTVLLACLASIWWLGRRMRMLVPVKP